MDSKTGLYVGEFILGLAVARSLISPTASEKIRAHFREWWYEWIEISGLVLIPLFMCLVLWAMDTNAAWRLR